MSYLRDYIHDLLTDGVSLSEIYSPEIDINNKVLLESEKLAEELGIDTTNYELRFFSRDYDGSVGGAAWVKIDEGKFKFIIALGEESNELHEDLIRDCLAEFDYENRDGSLLLEISVNNDEDRVVFESMGLKVLKEYVDEIVMGFRD